MLLSTAFAPVQRNVAFAIPLVAATWFVTVPGVLTTSSFIALLGVVTGFGWILRTTYVNARPASSLAQSLHDSEHTSSLEHRK